MNDETQDTTALNRNLKLIQLSIFLVIFGGACLYGVVALPAARGYPAVMAAAGFAGVTFLASGVYDK